MKKSLSDTIKNAKSAFRNTAKLEIDSGKLIVRNISPPHILHPFLHEGRPVQFLRLSQSEIVEVTPLL